MDQIKVKPRGESPKILEKVLTELRFLRQELALLLPQDDLKTYTHIKRIKHSYNKAIKQYPPASIWK